MLYLPRGQPAETAQTGVCSAQQRPIEGVLGDVYIRISPCMAATFKRKRKRIEQERKETVLREQELKE
jgi:hypothetical protein